MKPHWWQLPFKPLSDLVNRYVFDLATKIDHISMRWIHERDRRSILAYLSRSIGTSRAAVEEFYRLKYHAQNESTSRNIIRAITDGYRMRLTLGIPKGKLIPIDATFTAARTARAKDRAIYEELRRLLYKETISKLVGDSVRFGDAYLLPSIDQETREIAFEVFYGGQILVDESGASGRIEKPVSALRRRSVLKLDLVTRFAKFEREIVDAPSTIIDGKSSDMIEFVEGYKLGPNGAYFAGIRGTTFEYRKYSEVDYPWLRLNLMDPIVGYYAPSIAEYHLPRQLRLNKMELAGERIADTIIRPIYFGPPGSQAQAKKLREEDDPDSLVSFIEIAGPQPSRFDWGPIPEEILRERQELPQEAMEAENLNAFTAQNQIPSGFRGDSQRALREFDINQDRAISDKLSKVSTLVVEMTKRVGDLLADMHKRYPSKNKVYTISSGSFVHSISWRDHDWDRDRYNVVVETAATSNESSASRLEMVDRMIQQGMLSADMAAYAMLYPDVDDLLGLLASPVKMARMVAELLMDLDREPPAPHPHWPLERILEIVNLENQHLQTLHEDDELSQVLTRFSKWITRAEEMISEKRAAEQRAQADAIVQAQAQQGQGLPAAVPTNGIGQGIQ